MWETTATITRQSDNGNINQNDWNSSPTTPQENTIATDYPCTVRINSPNLKESSRGFNISGDALIVGPNSITVQEGDKLTIANEDRYKIISTPISNGQWIRIDAERL